MISSKYNQPGRGYRGLADQAGERVFLKRLVWLYFWLLIFEGAFRKWWLPQLSNPLLIVRDPVIILIYILSAQYRLMPVGTKMGTFNALLAITCTLGIVQFGMHMISLPVLLYGLRCYFLHVPLIFLLPQIFDAEDVRRIGKWVLLAAAPMAVLMVYQFRSAPDAWINRTVGAGEGLQLASAMGKIRPPGTFSFITGVVSFFAMATAFLSFGIAGRGIYPRWLQVIAAVSIALALAVSGSRSAVLESAIVMATFSLGMVMARQMAAGLSKLLLLVVITLFILGYTQHFDEGKMVLGARFAEAPSAEQAGGGLVQRFFNQFIGPVTMLMDIPVFGRGIGMGTNVGAKLMTGEMQFLVSEGEWGRMVGELGPLLGLAMVWFRLSLALWMGQLCYRAISRGNVLPLMLFSCSVLNMISGQWGQPTTLGFSVLGSALALTAAKHADQDAIIQVNPTPGRTETSVAKVKRTMYPAGAHGRRKTKSTIDSDGEDIFK